MATKNSMNPNNLPRAINFWITPPLSIISRPIKSKLWSMEQHPKTTKGSPSGALWCICWSVEWAPPCWICQRHSIKWDMWSDLWAHLWWSSSTLIACTSSFYARKYFATDWTESACHTGRCCTTLWPQDLQKPSGWPSMLNLLPILYSSAYGVEVGARFILFYKSAGVGSTYRNPSIKMSHPSIF